MFILVASSKKAAQRLVAIKALDYFFEDGIFK